MKRILVIMIMIALLLSMTSCSEMGQQLIKDTDDNSKSKGVSYAQLLEALEDADYQITEDNEKNRDYFGIKAALECKAFWYGQEGESWEDYGQMVYFAFKDQKEAEDAFDEMLKWINDNVIDDSMKKVYGKNGKKATYIIERELGDRKGGQRCSISQVGSTLIMFTEVWYFEGSGEFNNELENIMSRLGY